MAKHVYSDSIRSHLRSIALVAEKDMRIYYTKPPVLMFGFLFPLFMFLSFYLGRSADLHTLFPGLAAMFVFFVASSVGPLITPWEERAGTYERLLSSPASTNPSNIMMLSSLVRFPLIFISGIFVPIASLQGIALAAVYCSPITYLVAGFDLSLLGSTAIPIGLTWAALIGFSVVFVALASVLHRRNLMKGL